MNFFPSKNNHFYFPAFFHLQLSGKWWICLNQLLNLDLNNTLPLDSQQPHLFGWFPCIIEYRHQQLPHNPLPLHIPPLFIQFPSTQISTENLFRQNYSHPSLSTPASVPLDSCLFPPPRGHEFRYLRPWLKDKNETLSVDPANICCGAHCPLHLQRNGGIRTCRYRGLQWENNWYNS